MVLWFYQFFIIMSFGARKDIGSGNGTLVGVALRLRRPRSSSIAFRMLGLSIVRSWTPRLSIIGMSDWVKCYQDKSDWFEHYQVKDYYVKHYRFKHYWVKEYWVEHYFSKICNLRTTRPRTPDLRSNDPDFLHSFFFTIHWEFSVFICRNFNNLLLTKIISSYW